MIEFQLLVVVVALGEAVEVLEKLIVLNRVIHELNHADIQYFLHLFRIHIKNLSKLMEIIKFENPF